MQSRRAWWKGLFVAAAVACLVLLPLTRAIAGAPQTAVGGKDSGFAPVTEDNDKLRVTYPRSNYLWPYATGPFYGEVDPSQWASPGVLHFAVGSFDTQRGTLPFPAELRTTVKLDRQPAQYFVLQMDPASFTDGRFDSLRDRIVAAGGMFMGPVPVGAFVVRLNAGALAAIQGQPGVLFIDPYHPAYKLSPMIGRLPLGDPVRAVSSVYDLEVMLHDGEDAKSVAQAVAALGGNVTFVQADMIRVELNRDKLAALAALEPVASIVEFTPNFMHGEETTTTMQTGKWNLGSIPYHDAGVDGSGNGLAGTSPQVLMVLDSGIQLDAGDLSDTRTSPGTAGPTHRKVRLYTTTVAYGGTGDQLGCDNPQQGSFTHGHMVSATALGNATAVPTAYGSGWLAYDQNNPPKSWKLDGVAPRALLVAYDGNVTSTVTSCADPSADGISPGTLYTNGTECAAGVGTTRGSLCNAYGEFGARVFNFSWGGSSNGVYGGNARQIDRFLWENPSAMLFVSAGNGSTDTDRNGIPDNGTVADPATCKNAIVTGASDNANDGGTDYTTRRAGFSSVGPATTASQRIAPVLMAPGEDVGGLGIGSEYSCRTSDNDQLTPVECDVFQGASGTSFASPAAAGAALLVRDYFAQGFYPDGTSANSSNSGDQIPNISGALVKAILVASADFLQGWTSDPTRYRFNNEQGYGRIRLNNVLPLTTYTSPTGLVMCDGGISGGNCRISGFSGLANPSVTETTTLSISDTTKELRIGLAWIDEATGTTTDLIARDLDLELQSPTGRIYYGNYFTDDDNKNKSLDAGEDCAVTPWEKSGLVDNSAWSLPTCVNSDRDTQNPTEAIYLSPDPLGDGLTDNPATPGNEAADNQLEVGNWTLKVIGKAWTGTQKYAVAIAGPVQLGSSVRFKVLREDSLGNRQEVSGLPTCNDVVRVVVSEFAESTDPAPGLTPAEIASRTTIQVVDKGPDGVFGSSDDMVVDQETTTFAAPPAGSLSFESPDITLTDGTAPQVGNGVLDIRDGQQLKVIYRDKTNTPPPGGYDPNKERTNTNYMGCKVTVNLGGIQYGQFGRNFGYFVNGGCERDSRNLFTFGYPDKYLDHGEKIDYAIAFQSGETTITLDDAEASLRAVQTDTDSPANCVPGSTGVCTDPDRTNNPAVDVAVLRILDSPKKLGKVPPGAIIGVNFSIEMGSSISGTPTIEMVLGISAKKAGKAVAGIGVQRHKLDVDEVSLYYSTDFPAGGATQVIDWNNNETLENPTTYKGDINWRNDYRFEKLDGTSGSWVWNSLTSTGKNTTIQSPWNFDANNGNFTVGLVSITNPNIVGTIANWGEDKNFNNILDAGEDRDGTTGVLDNNWSTRGGCGWQTKTGGTTGGAWHTGRIDLTSLASCLVAGATTGQCQSYETYPGTTGQNLWWDLVRTPVVEKVNQQLDADGKPVYFVEFTNWAWNAEVDLPDSLAVFTWELDTDVDKLFPITLEGDGGIFNAISGGYGIITGGNSPLTDGHAVFADFSGTASRNGTIGNNHEGKNSCYFEQGARKSEPLGFAQPPDDDLRNGWCNNPSDTNDKQKSCTVATQATDCTAPYNGICNLDGTVTTDLYVRTNGPKRNWDMHVVNGIDLRQQTFEDLYGDSGTKFQGALGFLVAEGTSQTVPKAGFGVTVDDMVLEWREVRLDKDTKSNCASGGACATIDTASTNFYQGQARLLVTVLDTSPHLSGKNNCDLDFVCSNNPATSCKQDSDCGTGNTCNQDFSDAWDDTDCDNNGVEDVVVKAYNLDEPSGELAVLNKESAQSYRFTGSVPISSVYNVNGTAAEVQTGKYNGVLFVPRSGVLQPYANIRYYDDNDGTGAKCGNVADPSKRGVVETSTSVFVDTGSIVVASTRIANTGAGDNDGFADPGETVQMYITLSNKTRREISGVVARLATNDPNIECISVPIIAVGNMTKGASFEVATPFVFTVKNTVARSSVTQDLAAKFSVTVAADQFGTTLAPQTVTQDLDLDVTGGSGPQTFSESFEGTGLGQFTSMTMDKGFNSNTLSNGKRCQYQDPDFPNSNSYGETQCYLGFNGALDGLYNNFQWHQHTTTNPDGGRAYVGTRSLHWGYHQSTNADNDTTKFSQMDAVKLNAAVNLGYPQLAGSGVPELSFKHQASMIDYRFVNAPTGTAPDRAIVQIRLVDSVGTEFGNWIKLYPYENIYDVQATYNYINCTFDPDDDGNNEDSYFDPTDPNRTYGPSSTCFPEFNFSRLGDTDYRNKFIAGNVGRASDDEVGLKGSTDRGTWIQSKFNLERFRGRRATIRFLTTTIKVSDVPDPISLGFPNRTPLDDGWYIDDVTITNTLGTAATVAVDTKTPPTPTTCSTNCSSITAALAASPSSLAAPGQVVELDASGSTADKCLNGTLQYRFLSGGSPVTDWTDNPTFYDAPAATTTYGVEVRCSSALTCTGSTTASVSVTCPGGVSGYAGQIVSANGKVSTTISWPLGETVDVIRGDLIALRTNKSYNGSVSACVANNSALVTSVTDATAAPAPGAGFYWLVRGLATGCNRPAPTWADGSVKQDPGTDAEINADPDTCP